MLDPNGLYFAYLRKSREDREAELHGEGETLARHEKTLMELASRLHITISRTYREIVSGETIAARPEMLRLLNDMEHSRPDGILVTEIPRLARGNTKDQGLLMETFKYCRTKIITPGKIYDPNDEFDEEYAEFGLFMSRREYQSIRRRLNNGKTAASKEGKFAGSIAPYGYEKYKLPQDKGFSLRPVPDQAETVRLIFRIYLYGIPEQGVKPSGPAAIARILNSLHIPAPSSKEWSPSTVRGILTNCVYGGYIRWGRRKTVKQMEQGLVVRSHPLQEDYLISPALHEALISRELWHQAQQEQKRRSKRPPFLDSGLKNPLSGILLCGHCKKSMVRRPVPGVHGDASLICRTSGCPCCGSRFEAVEQCLIEALTGWFSELSVPYEFPSSQSIPDGFFSHALSERKEAATRLKKQVDTCFDLLERGVYSPELFRNRLSLLTGKLEQVKEEIRQLEHKALDWNGKKEPPRIEAAPIMSYYPNLSGESKNRLLMELVDRVEYFKEEKGGRNGSLPFRLKIYPRLMP